jgi:putative glutamine amidotransferase
MALSPEVGVDGADWPVVGLAPMELVGDSRQPALAARPAYLESVLGAGALPVMLAGPPERAEQMLRRVDALVIPGGEDIPPHYYGEAVDPEAELVLMDEALCDLYLALARAAIALGLPTLGVCLGAQVMNVACGGTLLQTLEPGLSGAVAHRGRGGGDRAHRIVVAPGSRLSGLVETGTAEVASNHRQSIKDPGEGLWVAARAPDGVVEAVEHGQHPFYLGVAWHAERTADARAGQGLFDALVAAARRKREPTVPEA